MTRASLSSALAETSKVFAMVETLEMFGIRLFSRLVLDCLQLTTAFDYRY
jgi:hypothetical protein